MGEEERHCAREREREREREERERDGERERERDGEERGVFMSSRLSNKQKARPLTVQVPQTERKAFSLSDSGTFTEGDLKISRGGLVISREGERSFERQSSRDSSVATTTTGFSNSNSRVGTQESLKESDVNYFGQPSCSNRLGVGEQDSGFNVAIDDLEQIGVLGCGSSGVVRKVRHKYTGDVLALKVIQLNVEDQVRKQINQELRALYEASSKYVIKYHQAFYDAGAITIVMEYMDGGSLLQVLMQQGKIPEKYLAEISRQVLKGLLYLHKERRILHRDIKPSNLLLNQLGEVKITDFGVSGQLANSVSKCVSWVGTITYMSPERISGEKYGYDSDVWSLGLSLVECALGRFPYPPIDPNQESGKSAMKLSFWDLLHYIVENPPPELLDTFSPEFKDFISKCLQKEPEKRGKVAELLEHPFLVMHEGEDINVSDLITTDD